MNPKKLQTPALEYFWLFFVMCVVGFFFLLVWIKRYKTVKLFAEFEFEVISSSCRCRTGSLSEPIKRSRTKQNSVVSDTDDLQLNANKRMQSTWVCFTTGAFGSDIGVPTVANLSSKTWLLCIVSSCLWVSSRLVTHTQTHETRPMLSPSQQPKNEHENAAMESTKNYIACNKLNLHTTFGSSTLKCRLSNIKIERKKKQKYKYTKMLQNERHGRCLSKFIMIFIQAVMKYSMRWQVAECADWIWCAHVTYHFARYFTLTLTLFSGNPYFQIQRFPLPTFIFGTYFCTYLEFSFRFYYFHNIFHYYRCSRSYLMSILPNASNDFARVHSIHRFASLFFILWRAARMPLRAKIWNGSLIKNSE